MPFISQTPRPFTKADVLTINPSQVGVYGLFKQGLWVYVGKGDIRERLLSHLGGDNPCIDRSAPTHWVGEITNGDPSARERQLILETNTLCNLRVG